MDEQRVVFDGPEFVARGRVELEKAELLRQVREEVLGAGRVLAAERVSPNAILEAPHMALQPRSDPLLTFLIVLAWLVGGVVLWLSLGW